MKSECLIRFLLFRGKFTFYYSSAHW